MKFVPFSSIFDHPSLYNNEMIEKPALSDEQICACIAQNYRLYVDSLCFLPLGNESNTWVFKVTEKDANTFFLKIKANPVPRSALEIPQFLQNLGIEQVVAPIFTLESELSAMLDGFTLILYPFIQGQTGMEQGLSLAQWSELGKSLHKIHYTPLPAQLLAQLKRETFQPAWGAEVHKLLNQPPKLPDKDAIHAESRQYWEEKKSVIGQVLARAEALGRLLCQRPPDFCLCHTDIHTANVLVDEVNRLHIVDWDQPLHAPKERDLMFMLNTPGRPAQAENPQEQAFLAGYGTVDVDAVTLGYYRYEWCVQELGDYGKRAFEMPELGESTRTAALTGLRELFAPGDVIEQALSFDQEYLTERDSF